MDTKQIKIGHLTVEIPQPYKEGHQLTEVEAHVLNQVFAENIRNNNRKWVKKVESGEVSEEMAIEAIQAYANEYEFTIASAGGGRASLTPVEKEARKIARQKITAALKAKGTKVKEVDKEKLQAAILTLASDPAVIEAAERRVAEMQAAAEMDLSDVLGEAA